jgi:hypothetical protein
MEKEFVPYEQALSLKELGFDETCIMAYYHLLSEDKKDKLFMRYNDNKTNSDNAISAPLFQQTFRWFREKYFIHCEIGRDFDTWDYELYDFKSGNKHIPTGFKTFNTYEEAEQECLIKLIELVKENK